MALFKVEICGVNTSKLPLLTEDEKKELFKEIKKGNEVARLHGNGKCDRQSEKNHCYDSYHGAFLCIVCNYL